VSHIFDPDTHVVDLGSGRFQATMTERWNRLGGGALGGYTLAIGMRALAASLPHPHPLAVIAHFVRAATSGPTDIQTSITRCGRRTSTARAIVSQSGKPVLDITATHGDLSTSARTEQHFDDRPSLPPPAACHDTGSGRSTDGVTIRERVDCRYQTPPGWSRGTPSGNPTTACWIRLKDRDADAFALALLVDAAAPVAVELGAAGSMTLELTLYLRGKPAPGWLTARIRTRCVHEGLHDEDVDLWDSTGRLFAQARQLAVYVDGEPMKSAGADSNESSTGESRTR
jgi:acyl-CoA thioesterase